MMLYKHKNNTDVAAEVLKFFSPEGKDYAYIKVRWWRIRGTEVLWNIGLTTKLTDATIEGNSKDRQKYPLEKWTNNWEIIEV